MVPPSRAIPGRERGGVLPHGEEVGYTWRWRSASSGLAEPGPRRSGLRMRSRWSRGSPRRCRGSWSPPTSARRQRHLDFHRYLFITSPPVQLERCGGGVVLRRRPDPAPPSATTASRCSPISRAVSAALQTLLSPRATHGPRPENHVAVESAHRQAVQRLRQGAALGATRPRSGHRAGRRAAPERPRICSGPPPLRPGRPEPRGVEEGGDGAEGRPAAPRDLVDDDHESEW